MEYVVRGSGLVRVLVKPYYLAILKLARSNYNDKEAALHTLHTGGGNRQSF